MADIATLWSPDSATGDWALSGPLLGTVVDSQGVTITDDGGFPITDGSLNLSSQPGLVSGGDLVTSVIISLFTDAAAEPDDAIPDGSGDPRGWWAAPIGSQLWLRMRSKKTPTLLTLVQNDIARALDWMIQDGVAQSVDVTTEWQVPSRLAARIVIHRGGGAAVLNFAWAWEAI